jgi:hypothetical protein
MPKITIDGTEYHTEDLSENGRAVLESLQFTEMQLQKVSKELKIYQLAQQTYAAALKVEVQKEQLAEDPSSDISKE